MLDRATRAHVFTALGDPTRLAIVELLQVQDLSPDALAAALEIPSNLLSHHLKVLQGAGVIQRKHSQHDRRRTYVQLNDESLVDLLPQPRTLSAPRVVFVCTHNSARSVLADAVWRTASDVPSTSAGTHPAAQINPRARAIARRSGLTLATDGPRSIDDVLRPDDLVVSVCDAVNEELSDLTQTHFHWSVPDPSALDTDAAFAETVRELRERVGELAPCIHRRPPSPNNRRAHA